jgi:hypothetical protein
VDGDYAGRDDVDGGMTIKKISTRTTIPQLPEKDEDMPRFLEDLVRALMWYERDVKAKLNEVIDEVNSV